MRNSSWINWVVCSTVLILKNSFRLRFLLYFIPKLILLLHYIQGYSRNCIFPKNYSESLSRQIAHHEWKHFSWRNQSDTNNHTLFQLYVNQSLLSCSFMVVVSIKNWSFNGVPTKALSGRKPALVRSNLFSWFLESFHWPALSSFLMMFAWY